MEVASFLLQWDCFVNAVAYMPIHDGEAESVTPLDLARIQGQKEMEDLLIEEGGLSYRRLVTVAATKIQSVYRGFIARRGLEAVKEVFGFEKISP